MCRRHQWLQWLFPTTEHRDRMLREPPLRGAFLQGAAAGLEEEPAKGNAQEGEKR